MRWTLLTVLALVLLSGCIGQSPTPHDGPIVENTTDTSNTTQEGPVTNPDAPDTGSTDQVTVHITDSGFDPETVSVPVGGTVTWVNELDRAAWPASDIHPSHTQYSGGEYGQAGSYGGSRACTGEGEQKGDAFDPCHEISPGERWSFTFNEPGVWGYHDHLRPSITGSVVVSEEESEDGPR